MASLVADLTAFPHSPQVHSGVTRGDYLIRSDALRLSRDQIMRTARPLGKTVHCVEGSLWLTFDEDCRDVVLAAGDRHICDRNTTLTIQALDEDARIYIG